MRRSLRWRLLIWSGLLLVLVVAGFGTTLYFQVRHGRLATVDADLEAALRVLEGSLRAFPRHLLDPSQPGPPGPPGPPGRPGFGPGPGGPRGAELLRALDLPESRRLDGPPVYFVVWNTRGEVLKATPLPPGYPELDELLALLPRPTIPTARHRNEFREMVMQGPERTLILAGRGMRREMEDLGRLTWQTLLAGVGAVGIGMFGVWWVTGRAVRPIELMSTTAASITAMNLSRRIDTEEADSELGQLGLILNAMFDRLETAFDQQVRFTADASHELRTPLSVLISHLELALSRQRPAEEYRQTLLTCQRAARRMQALVGDLLILARADAGRLELTAERVELSLLAEECVELLEPLARERGVVLTFVGDPVEIPGDPDRLAQVLSNLVTNALQYNRPNGSVTVRVRLAGDAAELSVMDTGLGIESAHLPHLFERFYRVDSARTRDRGGSGLGLAICQSIVLAHGGGITVESKAGLGTTFTVRLPL